MRSTLKQKTYIPQNNCKKVKLSMREWLLAALIAVCIMPKTSKALEGIIMDSDTNTGIPDAVVRFYDGHWLMDSTRTDERGRYSVTPVYARLPEENIILPSIDRIYLTDINGRTIKTLSANELNANLPSKFHLPSGTYFLATENSAVQFTSIEKGNIPFNPLISLQEKAKQIKEHYKNSSANTTCEANDNNWVLSVTDDNIRGQIGEYYDANIPVKEMERFPLFRDVELIRFYNMEDWDGDFLEYVQRACVDGGTGPRSYIWGDYPQYYPIPVNLDSAGCYRYNTESGARLRLSLVIDAFNRWEQKSNINYVDFYGRYGGTGEVFPPYRSGEISIEWSSEQAMFADIYGKAISPEDQRAINGLADIFIGYGYSDEQINEWFPSIQGSAGWCLGWTGHFPPNPYSIMHLDNGRIATEVTNDDGKVMRTHTLTRAYTNFGYYIQE